MSMTPWYCTVHWIWQRENGPDGACFPVESENISGGSVGNGGDGNRHDICVFLMKVYS